MIRRSRRFWRLYVLWTIVCAALFFALADADDPSRPKGRILSADAGRRALAILRDRDADRFRDYEAVHVAGARAREGGDSDRWVVLLDRVPHTRLEEAFVVELRRSDGSLLRIRRPLY